MKVKFTNLLFLFVLMLGFTANTDLMAQSGCKKDEAASCTKKDKSACCATEAKQTSGCTPSSCRGAKTKFGEAKVITGLRESLIALKAKMEKSKQPVFSPRSYDIHGIVGKSDNESLQILVREVKLVEGEVAQKLNKQLATFALPKNKAKQIKYLNERISALQTLL